MDLGCENREPSECDFPNRGHLDGECYVTRCANWVDGCPQDWMRESVTSESVGGCTVGASALPHRSLSFKDVLQSARSGATRDAYSHAAGGRVFRALTFPRLLAWLDRWRRRFIIPLPRGVCEIVIGETRRAAIVLAKVFRDREIYNDRIWSFPTIRNDT